MESSLEELNHIEKRFRKYILILDFLLRETRTELSQNRAKRETWHRHNENWKLGRVHPENNSFQNPNQKTESTSLLRTSLPFRPISSNENKPILRNSFAIQEFRPAPFND